MSRREGKGGRKTERNAHVSETLGAERLAERNPLLLPLRTASLVEETEGSEANTETVGTDGGDDFVDGLESEAVAVFDRTAVLVRASVDVVVVELCKEEERKRQLRKRRVEGGEEPGARSKMYCER